MRQRLPGRRAVHRRKVGRSHSRLAQLAANGETTRKDNESQRPAQPTGYRNSLESRHARVRSEVKNGAEEGRIRNFSEPRMRLARPATPGPGSPVDRAQTPFFIQKHEDS